VTPTVVSCSLDYVKTYIADRATRTARETYGAPFEPSARSFAFAAHDDAQKPPLAVLSMTIAGGVAMLDELVFDDPQHDDGAARMLIRRFEETASYQNCHKACARVARDGPAAELLTRAGFRIGADLPRHYFQKDFVEMVKWLQ
jgi:hypothetical protein